MTTNVPQTYTDPRTQTDGMAIAALVTGLCGLSIIPIVLGHLSLQRIRRTGAGGQALAVVGLVLGYATLAAIVVTILFVVVMSIWAVNS